jgi:hypothetical protein
MVKRRFSWDDVKNQSNLRKHNVSFEVACHVFDDPLHVSVQDRFEGGEQRWQTFGMVGDCVILLVAHTMIEDDENGEPVEFIRIISARRADRRERQRYENEIG